MDLSNPYHVWLKCYLALPQTEPPGGVEWKFDLRLPDDDIYLWFKYRAHRRMVGDQIVKDLDPSATYDIVTDLEDPRLVWLFWDSFKTSLSIQAIEKLHG